MKTETLRAFFTIQNKLIVTINLMLASSLEVLGMVKTAAFGRKHINCSDAWITPSFDETLGSIKISAESVEGVTQPHPF